MEEVDKSRPLTIFLADDDPDDLMIFEDALFDIKANVDLKAFQDGSELMYSLLHPEEMLPDMIFLDLNMPLKDGLECLEEIRSNKRLQHVFIVIYSTTSNPREIDKTHVNGANLFINKPNTYTELKSILSKILALDHKEYFPNREKEKFILIV